MNSSPSIHYSLTLDCAFIGIRFKSLKQPEPDQGSISKPLLAKSHRICQKIKNIPGSSLLPLSISLLSICWLAPICGPDKATLSLCPIEKSKKHRLFTDWPTTMSTYQLSPQAAQKNVSMAGGFRPQSQLTKRCFICTAALGSHIEPQATVLRDFGEQYLLTIGPGNLRTTFKLK